MRLHFVSVPVLASAASEDELNKFLGSHRVVAVDRQLVPDGSRSAWAVCVAYVDGAPAAAAGAPDATGQKRVDYREILPPAEFQVFAKLRDLRKKVAEHDGVPPYAVFTNEQLADLVRRKVQTADDLARVDGVGPARVQKYGGQFLAVLCGTEAPAPAGST